MASFGSANPDNVGSMEVVKVLLEIALSAKSNGAVIQITHRTLVLLEGWCH